MSSCPSGFFLSGAAVLNLGLENTARAELRYGGRFNLDALTRLWVTADPGRPSAGAECSKADKRGRISLSDGIRDGLERRVNNTGYQCLGLSELLRNQCNQFCLVYLNLLVLRRFNDIDGAS